MKKFYIVYKDDCSHIEGQVNCDEKQFEIRFITPQKDQISSYYLGKEQIKPKEELELNTELLNDLI